MADNDKAVRAVAYLKEFITDTLERMHTGGLDQPQTAKLLWKEIEDIFRRTSGAQDGYDPFRALGRIRVTVPPSKTAEEVLRSLGNVDVVTARLMPPPPPPLDVPPEAVKQLRELLPTDSVLYLDVKAQTVGHLLVVIASLEANGLQVRDWTYGY